MGKTLILLFSLFAFTLVNSLLSAQEGKSTLHGVVRDEQDAPLQGATVRGIGNLTVVTDGQGKFSISLSSEMSWPVALSVSYIGYQPQELVLEKNESPLSIRLEKLGGEHIEETVVIGYGKSSREKLTSSIVKISGTKLVQQPIQDPVAGLQGMVAGLYMTMNSGNLGAQPNILIRGDNTIKSSSNPLYIIDGVPMPSSGINSNRIGGATGIHSPFINLNSSDIESIEVLKDADATAIYGTRGANGVILITSKKGKAGQTRVSFDFYRGTKQAINKMDMLGTEEYLQMRRDAFALEGKTPTAVNDPDLLVWDQTAHTDFQDLLFGKVARLSDGQASVTGGKDGTSFALALGYRDENGVILGTNNQKRGNARLNINHRSPNDRLQVNGGINYNVMTSAMAGTSAISAYAIALAPNLPLRDEVDRPYAFSTSISGTSPLYAEHSNTNLKNYQLVASATVGYNILDNLNLKVDASYTRLDYNGVEKYGNGYLNPKNSYTYTNYAYFGTDYQYTYNVEPQLNYSVQIGNTKLSGLLGATWQETQNGGQIVEGQNFANELLMTNLGAAGRVNWYMTTYNQYKFNSLFARGTYDYANRYILNLTYRRDGSSRFAPGNRFGHFWALGGAWILSREAFFSESLGSTVSFAKLRASYGLTGNDGIENYQYMETYAPTGFPYNHEAGIYANRMGNSTFRWESNHQFEAALEIGLFNSRITSTAAFFNKQGSNQLVNYPLSGQTGWTRYVANLEGALIRNRGVEFELASHNVKAKDFNWRTAFNITSYKNTLVSFPGLSASTYSNDYEVGKSIKIYRLYEFDHIDPETGIPYVVDQNGDGKIDSTNDYISYGSSDPAFYGGLGNTFSYKGFELDVFFYFVKRPYARGLIYSYARPIGNMYNAPRYLVDRSWRSPEDPRTLPRLSAATSGDFYTAYINRYRLSTASIDDASFIRLRNLSISYTIPARYTERLKINNLRVYALGQNLLTWTKFLGTDPETGSSTTPLQTIYTLGINLSL